MDRFARSLPPPSARPLRLATPALAVCLAACADAGAVRTDEVDVRLVSQQAAWQAAYLVERPGAATSEIPTGREVHVPVGADVRFALSSVDYICGFTLPGLGVRDFAAPGLPAEIRFTAPRAGRYDLRGDALCGLPHTDRSRGVLVVEDADAFRHWVERRARGAAG